MERSQFKIMIIEDEILVAMDIEEILQRCGYVVVGIADRLENALDIFRQKSPQLIVSDIKIKGSHSGIQVVDELKKIGAPFEVIFLTAYSEEKTLHHAFKTRPKSYLLKPFTEMQLEVSVDQVYQDYIFKTIQAVDCPFTSRELEILELLKQGFSSNFIAKRFFLSVETVKTHRKNMRSKLSVSSSIEMVNLAVEKGWI